MALKSVLFSIPLVAALTAQVTREHSVVLKNWPAPLYWQPSQAETEATGEKTQAPRVTPTALIFVAMTPCRVVDTRASQHFPDPFGQPGLTPGAARTFTIQTSTLCSIPATAQAYSFNVTLVPPGVVGYLKLYPHGQPEPNAVTLDDLLGTIVNNAAIVPAGVPNGAVDAVVNGNTDLVLDINGYYAPPNTTNNTAYGISALSSNTGSDNTANGFCALCDNAAGSYNTANGALALAINTAGNNNTANGYESLFFNTTGNFNTANGGQSLQKNTTGDGNTADGYQALFSNTNGFYNTASGYQALFNNTTAAYQTAVGWNALYLNTVGSNNTAIGELALSSNVSGSFNVALGQNAGALITGDNNIVIGNLGTASDNNVTRIGDPNPTFGQKSFFAAGIRGVTTGNHDAMPVMIDSNGQLGTVSSSRRFKEDIQDMAESSSGLLRLRPVSYRYQKPYADGSKPIDYGLIAEEVAEVYPDLVVNGKDGQVETVQYQKLTPMLLNELQKEHETVRSLRDRVSALEKALETLIAGKAQ